ncbi:unnamed protein product [Clonostachys solani]|uniref:Uncharacterized protein n=1 Tax=Clonostachys solani TaxID=160281 RepID=A0A9N9YZF6_9HYPO|nr:unnamed protein product [Clonostachys solani]
MTKTAATNISEVESFFLTAMDALAADVVFDSVDGDQTFHQVQLDLLGIRFMRCSRIMGLAHQEVPYIQGCLSNKDLVTVYQRMFEFKAALDRSGTFVPADTRAAHVDPDPDSLRGWLSNFQRDYRRRFNAEHPHLILKWVPKTHDHIQTMLSSFNDAIVSLEQLVGHDIMSLARQDAVELAKAPCQAHLMEVASGTDPMLFELLQEEQKKKHQQLEQKGPQDQDHNGQHDSAQHQQLEQKGPQDQDHNGQHDSAQHQEQLQREYDVLQTKLAGIRCEQTERNESRCLAPTVLEIKQATTDQDLRLRLARMEREQAAANQHYLLRLDKLQREQRATDQAYHHKRDILQKNQATSELVYPQQEAKLQSDQAIRDQDRFQQMTAIDSVYSQRKADLQRKLGERKSELRRELGQRKSELQKMLVDADLLFVQKSMELRTQCHREKEKLWEEYNLQLQKYSSDALALQHIHTMDRNRYSHRLAELKSRYAVQRKENSNWRLRWKKQHILQQEDYSRQIIRMRREYTLKHHQLEQQYAKGSLDHLQWQAEKQQELEELEDQLQRIQQQMPLEMTREQDDGASAINNPTSNPSYVYRSLADWKARQAVAADTPSKATTADAPSTPTTTSSVTIPSSAPEAPSRSNGPIVPIYYQWPTDDPSVLIGQEFGTELRNRVIDNSLIMLRPDA